MKLNPVYRNLFAAICSACLLMAITFSHTTHAQEKKDLGDDEYIIVKALQPVLVESYKISESPEGDTTSSTPPVMDYNIRSRKAQTEYETAVIKAVKIKDESLAKLYRSYLRLGIGNYTTYSGDLYVNALRSKKGAVGLALNHHSGNPGLKKVGYAGFGKNHGGIYGKYFLEKSTFSGDINYNRDVIHYYGYDADKIIIAKEDIKQRYNKFGMNLNYGSNHLSKDKLSYSVGFGFSSLNDSYDVSESDFHISGKVGKKVSDFYLNLDAGFNYFRKSLAEGEVLSLTNDLSRSIVTFVPTLSMKQNKMSLVLGLNVGIEKNVGSKVRMFPKIDLSLPIAENVLYAFAGVNGNIVKNNYHTMVAENPFVSPAILPLNTINKLELKAGLNGNFSSLFSFMTQVKYSTIDNMLLYYIDSVSFNQFSAIYVNGKVLNLHAELGYNASEKFQASLRFDQYSYSMELKEKAWHKPSSEVALNLKYNLLDKIKISADLYARGKYDVRITDTLGFTSKKVKGYMDVNLGFEYQYSKILSLFLNFNNLGLARYERWYNYPSERLNVLGGIKFSF